MIQGDHLFEELLAIAAQPSIEITKIAASPPEDDARVQRALEQAHKDYERRSAPASRSLRKRLKELLGRANEARAIYEDVRLHGPPAARVIALMRLGQLDADLEQATSISSIEEHCATNANWAIWKDAYVEPREGLYTDRAKEELVFCFEEAKRLMLVDQIDACESELNRVEPLAYPVQAEIVPEPRP
jgi:hypothetical protein